MKSNWERTKALIIPELITAKRMLHPFLKGSKIINIEPLGGGLSNSNMKFTLSNGEKYVLRIYNDGVRKAQIEKGVLEYVNEILPVPRVFYHDFSMSQFDYPFVVLNWVEGFQLAELFHAQDSKSLSEAAKEIGRYLAKMHSIQFASPGFFDEQLNVEAFETDSDSFMKILEDIISGAPITQNLGAEMIQDIRHFAEEQVYLLEQQDNLYSLVHSDFNPFNILIEKVEDAIEVTGILDWEFAFSNSPLIDIGNMLRFEDVQESTFIQPFIQSYLKHGGQLPHNWLKKAKLLDVIALCDLANHPNCGKVRLYDIKLLLKKTVNQWDLFTKVEDEMSKNIAEKRLF